MGRITLRAVSLTSLTVVGLVVVMVTAGKWKIAGGLLLLIPSVWGAIAVRRTRAKS